MPSEPVIPFLSVCGGLGTPYSPMGLPRTSKKKDQQALSVNKSNPPEDLAIAAQVKAVEIYTFLI